MINYLRIYYFKKEATMSKRYQRAIILLLYLSAVNFTTGVSSSTFHYLEAENFVTDRSPVRRLNASGNKSIHFNEGDFVKVYFCLRTETEVAIVNIPTSNDGGSDIIDVRLDNTDLGNVTTMSRSEGGELWNHFVPSPQVGPTLRLSSGYHVISLNFTSSDKHGVEVDSIHVRTNDKYLEEDLFKCSLYCVPDNLYDNGPVVDTLPTITIQRKTHPLDCQKQDNIIMPLFHPKPEAYIITAMLPRYRTFENHRDSHFEECVAPSNILWNFDNFDLPVSDDEPIVKSISTAASIMFNTSRLTNAMTLRVKFSKTSPISNDDGKINTNHVLVLKFRNVMYPFAAQMQYKGKTGKWSEEFAKYFSSQVRSDIWTIPETEWSSISDNEIQLVILTNPWTPETLTVDTFRLIKRTLKRKTDHTIYNSRDVKVEVVDERANTMTKMSVERIDSGEEWKNVDYLKISHILPWTRKFAEVLRLDQSGKLQLLPLTPPGLEKIPFGSSFIVGQSDPNERFPAAPISKVSILPDKLELSITYKDESRATLILKPSLHNTKVIVKDLVMKKDTKTYPFVSLSSMWLNDGNSEVDHISSNGNRMRHIVNGWLKLHGTSFTFMKKCVSKYNTQGPDMRLQLVPTSVLYQQL